MRRVWLAEEVGDGQTAEVQTELTDPIQVQVLRGDGSPFAGKVVTFSVTRSDGSLSLRPEGPGVTELTTLTEADGTVYEGEIKHFVMLQSFLHQHLCLWSS